MKTRFGVHSCQSGVRRMLLAKNNLLRNPKGLAYIVNDGIISFTDTTIEMDADEYQRQNFPNNRGRPNVKTKEAEDWLREYLKDGEKLAGNKNNPEPGTIFGDAIAHGLKCGTVWDASKKIGVHREQEALSKRWIWSLPKENDTFAEFDVFGEKDF